MLRGDAVLQRVAQSFVFRKLCGRLPSHAHKPRSCKTTPRYPVPPPKEAHGDKEESIARKTPAQLRHGDRIPRGGDVGSGKDADRETGGPRLFDLVMERSNSCARIEGHSNSINDQTAAFRLFVGAHAGVFGVA
jgi:hypothetical protein